MLEARHKISAAAGSPAMAPTEEPFLIAESATGFLLMASDFKPIYANAEAIRILVYPEAPEPLELLDGFLADKIRSVILANGHGPHSAFTTEFTSGRRHYLCRTFALNSHPNHGHGPDHPALAAILERSSRRSFDAAQVAARFHLTPREQETLQHLMQGFTNKEIGQRMNISPNTVKAFLKLIMMKMGVSTRSGIIGKTVIPEAGRPALISDSARFSPEPICNSMKQRVASQRTD
jgi:DNA-binding CsgD family transcriptional regulator